MDWQPIETDLPLEGMRVIAIVNGEVVIARMDQSPERFVLEERPFYGTWIREMQKDDFCNEDEYGYCWPTHWMPLPEPPK